MTSPEELPPIVEIEQGDRHVLAARALTEVRKYEPAAEVMVYLKNLMEQSDIEYLTGADAYAVPVETFRNIGSLLQRLLADENDRRTVKRRPDERAYRVVYDEDALRERQGRRRHGGQTVRSTWSIGRNHPF